MSFSNFMFGNPDQMQQVSRQSPDQQSLMKKYSSMMQNQQAPQFLSQSPTYQSGVDYLQNLYSQSPDAFERFKQPYMRQFQQETMPSIAERFASMGSGGNLSSSSFNQALARAGEGLSSTLGSQMEQLKAQMIPQLLSYGQAPMNQYSDMMMNMLGLNPVENVYQPGSTGFLGNLASGMATGAGHAFGGPFGAAGAQGLTNALFGNKPSANPANIGMGNQGLMGTIRGALGRGR